MGKKKDLKSKSPTAAGILAIIPGAGHLYCGRYKDAAIVCYCECASTQQITACCGLYPGEMQVMPLAIVNF